MGETMTRSEINQEIRKVMNSHAGLLVLRNGDRIVSFKTCIFQYRQKYDKRRNITFLPKKDLVSIARQINQVSEQKILLQ